LNFTKYNQLFDKSECAYFSLTWKFVQELRIKKEFKKLYKGSRWKYNVHYSPILGFLISFVFFPFAQHAMSSDQVLTVHVKYLSATEFLAINNFVYSSLISFFLSLYAFGVRLKVEGKRVQWWHVFCGIMWFIVLVLNAVGEYFWWDLNDIDNAKWSAGMWLFFIQQWNVPMICGFWLMGWKVLSWMVAVGVFFISICAEVFFGIVSTNDNVQAVYAWIIPYLLVLLFVVFMMPFDIWCSTSSSGAQDPQHHQALQTTEVELSHSAGVKYTTDGTRQRDRTKSKRKDNYILNPIETNEDDSRGDE